jgi:hypothetical protein
MTQNFSIQIYQKKVVALHFDAFVGRCEFDDTPDSIGFRDNARFRENY